jgi:activating signal cointegrator complex subunit 1
VAHSTARTKQLSQRNLTVKQEAKPTAQMRFDARALIDSYKAFTWAKDVRIDRVQICKMGAKKVWSGGKDGEGEVVDEKYEVVCEKGIFE